MWGTVKETDGGLLSNVRGECLYEGGEFWADGIARLKDDPVARLAMALRHLPLPGAFREASVALRAMIRARRKSKLPFEEELNQLHRLAAMASLAPYDDLELTPYTEFERIDLRPETIGWTEIVGTTDAKWMAEAWPAPERHTTAQALYPEIALASAARCANITKSRRANLLDFFEEISAEDQLSNMESPHILPVVAGSEPMPQARASKGFFARLFAR